ncbi:MAG: competence/damage-inducible protein A [Haliangiales bacterium]
MLGVHAEILTIGDELCRGEIIDTNAAWLAAALWELDVTTVWMTSCRDVTAEMRLAFDTACQRADLVIVSGGLGPTEDDRTIDVLSALAGVEPELDEPSRQRLEARFGAGGVSLTANSLRQVRAPAGARVWQNPVGLAPGFEISLGSAAVICMPGVPAEMRALFEGGIGARIAELRDARGDRVERVARCVYRVFGAGESELDHTLAGLSEVTLGASLHFQVVFPEVLIKAVVRAADAEAASAGLARIDRGVRERLGDKLYGCDDDSFAAVVGRDLLAHGATVVTAESCTGGLIGAMLTEVAGSSRYFLGGAITYTNEEKQRQLGVPEAVFIEHGAVSEACVRAMATGARERFGADYALSVSGVAGPGGGTEDKPVGTVWLALAGPGGVRVQQKRWSGDRARVRRVAAFTALAMLRGALAEEARDASA